MSRLISVKIDVTKIDKSRLFKGEKGTYLDCDIWLNDDPDQYGNDCSVNMSQTKEEREAKEKKIYIGNGKKVFGWGDSQAENKPTSTVTEDDEDIPF